MSGKKRSKTPSSKIRKTDIDGAYKIALELYNSRNYLKVIEYLTELLKTSPKNAELWNLIGVAHGSLGNSQKAVECYEHALQIDPQYAKTWYNLGIVYGNMGNFQKAIECCEQALKINPQDALVWYNLGVANQKEGNSEKAIECYEHALHINPQHAKAWYNLGTTYGNIGNHQKEKECHEKALKISPTMPMPAHKKPTILMQTPADMGEKCIVCLLSMEEDADIGKCPYCDHFAHLDHLLEWIKTHGFCPFCKEKLTSNSVIIHISGTSIHCQNCGATLSKTAKICPNCSSEVC